MRFGRRKLVAGGGALALGATLPLLLSARSAPDRRRSGLVRDPDGLLDLPAGFRYRVLENAFDRMSDGLRVPARPDGMGCFRGPNGTLALMRNHELDRNQYLSGWRSPPSESFDPACHGAVTRLVVDARTFERRSSNLVLAGTLRNCAGGSSPWGWLSCEEAVDKGHGYVFLCRTDAERVERPRPIRAYGRFNHEAACVDPQTLIAYLTEDRYDGCFYRFVPRAKGQPFVGELQALRVRGRPRHDSSTMRPGVRVAVDWVSLPDPDPPDDTLREQALERGAALMRRGEGLFFAHGSVWICATAGGPAGAGQSFRLTPGRDSDAFELVAQSTSREALNSPDNISVAPWGDVIMAEDGQGEQHVRGLTRHGRSYEIARNAKSGGEFAGVCLSLDGRALFLNMQHEGLTVVVTGPFETLGRSA